MMAGITNAAVIGAGVMGAGIAAHLANAGINVVLLDIERKYADAGVARQLKANGFMDPAFADRIKTGSTSDDLALAADADWIIEAVAERLDVKQALYFALDGVRRPGSIVSSNTSTIRLATLLEGMSERFAQDFLITHFFNPPRIMPLFELVAGPKTRPDAAQTIHDFADRGLGKTVVVCKDTPGFIGNRVGNYWMLVAQNEAIQLGLAIEEADAVISKPFGIPGTGIFGLLDLVGIDLLPTALRSLQNALPQTDALQAYDAEPALIARMTAENRTGRKSGAGFVRLAADRKSREVTDLVTGDYRPMKSVQSESLDATKGDVQALMEHAGSGGRYASVVMEKTLAYAVSLVPEIADTPDAVDAAMCTGYGWKQGPFALIDSLGAGWLADRLTARGLQVPNYLNLAVQKGGFYSVIEGKRCCLLPDGSLCPISRAEGIISLADHSLAAGPVADYGAAALWDVGDGVACLEFRTKLNTFSLELLDAIDSALVDVGKGFQALVIGSDRPYFSAGANLQLIVDTMAQGGAKALGAFVERGQQTFKAIKYAPFPVVGAPAGLAVGGGCEILLHCDAIQAHAELSIGLVEAKVGLLPGWGGCKEMLRRLYSLKGTVRGPMAPAMSAFNLIARGTVSKSAFEARSSGFLAPSDGITMNRDRLIADAKRKALELVHGYTAPEQPEIALVGPSGSAAMRGTLEGEVIAGRATAHNQRIGEALIEVLTGGPDADPLKPLSEDDIMALEKKAFLTLAEMPETIARVKHILATGKPLQN
ncbi:3-hydroxyacyl-CoA dehydrogenase/enoyl-CoA hydratase family protein [Hoeflea sp. Naph1]|uniref:3-hydroxyacyl-CoA dehydrogenase/enoyl-CoA hydratase family protein n=1 Tax=Hoeflea sp. Naph1 TaxID=3388653 RepID=UPI0039903511